MKTDEIKVPSQLLLDRKLAGTAKVLWMILQVGQGDGAQISPRVLAARSGLTKPTIRRGLAQLDSAGWLRSTPIGDDTTPKAWVPMPSDLLFDSQIGVQSKLLYGTLQLTPGFGGHSGDFTYFELIGLTGLSANTVKLAVRSLQGKGWLQISQKNKFSPLYFTLRNPAAERREAEVSRARQRLEEASFLGEALMREYLNLIIDSDEFDDNCTPGYLVNPFTGEEMQFDRYYPPRVAFEFNGPQHYGPTARYSNEAESRKQQGRDYIKIGICAARGINLVVVHPKDLTTEGLIRKVDGLLPLRKLDGCEHLTAYLESVSRAYRQKARRNRGVASPDSN